MLVAVVLAAGSGSRFGPGHKLLADLDGTPVLRRAVDAAVAAAIGPVVVVTGATDLGAALGELEASGAVTVVSAPDAGDGQARSLAAGVDAARRAGADGVVVGLGDMPLVPASAWRAVATADAPAGAIVAAVYSTGGGTVRRPPVRIPSGRWDELPAAGDEGARALLRSRPDLVVEVPVAGDPLDVDRVTDIGRAMGVDRRNG